MERLYLYILIAAGGYLFSRAETVTIIPAKINRDATLPCRLPPDSYEGINVRWFSDSDGWLTSGSKVYKHQGIISVTKPAPNEWNLRISKVSLKFEDKYTCKTDKGAIISTVKLVIQTPPKIDESASSDTTVFVKEHDTAQLVCVVTGTPTPEIHWYRGTAETDIGISGPVLKIRDVKRYAADEYMCRAKNINGEAERRMRVKVNFAPEVTVFEPEVYAAGGEVVVMSCVVQAAPLFKAYWTKGTNPDGTEILANWKYIVLREEAEDGLPVTFLTLIIKKSIVSEIDYGMYTCVAKGEVSVAHGSLELKKRFEKTGDETENVIRYE